MCPVVRKSRKRSKTGETATEKKSEISYNISVSLGKGGGELETRNVSHMTLCMYNGVKKLEEAIQDKFDCDCDEAHCGKAKQIKMTATEIPSNQINKDSQLLKCVQLKNIDKSRLPVALREVHLAPRESAPDDIKPLSLQTIMEEEIIKPHRPGNL